MVIWKETVSRAIDHMMLTFDETEVFVDAYGGLLKMSTSATE